MGLLEGLRCYLVGAMDLENDHGVIWRLELKPMLEARYGLRVRIPRVLAEYLEEYGYSDDQIEKWLDEGNYSAIYELIRILRHSDLREVDQADFIIARIHPNHYTCGSYEEIFLADRQKKPVLLWIEGDQGEKGYVAAPRYLWGCFRHRWFFASKEEILEYLDKVDREDEAVIDYSRWEFFEKSKRKSLFYPRAEEDFERG